MASSILTKVLCVSLIILNAAMGGGGGCAARIAPHAERINAATEAGDDDKHKQAGSARLNYSPMPMRVTFGKRFLAAPLNQDQLREIEQLLAWTPGLCSYHVKVIRSGVTSPGEVSIYLEDEIVDLAHVNGKWKILNITNLRHSGW